MGIEIERKSLLLEGERVLASPEFLAKHPLPELVRDIFTHGDVINQGYLPLDGSGNASLEIICLTLGIPLMYDLREARLRVQYPFLRAGTKRYTFTMKGPGTQARPEEEYPLTTVPDIAYFNSLWELTKGARIDKLRYTSPFAGKTEFDFYRTQSLIVAEN